MVKSVPRSAGLTAPIEAVRAKQGKAERAVPIALLSEQGRVSLHGEMCSLEEELRGLVAGGVHQGAGDSSDRADAILRAGYSWVAATTVAIVLMLALFLFLGRHSLRR